jgi:hypothetical protein
MGDGGRAGEAKHQRRCAPGVTPGCRFPTAPPVPRTGSCATLSEHRDETAPAAAPADRAYQRSTVLVGFRPVVAEDERARVHEQMPDDPLEESMLFLKVGAQAAENVVPEMEPAAYA